MLQRQGEDAREAEGATLAGAAEDLRKTAWIASSFLLGLLAAPLPARWRRAIPLLESSAWGPASIPSALVQALVGLVLFAFGYVAWMDAQGAAIDAAAEASGGDTGEKKILGRALMLGNPILPIVYAVTTPSGLLLAVICAGGVVRMLHGAVTRDVLPDPVLGAIDWAAAKLRRRAAAARREQSKDASPDRLILGSKADDFAIIIETAKDLDWREGNTIVVARTWYRLKSKGEEMTPGGLRLRYVLEEMPIGVAIRGVRTYDPGHAPIIVGNGDASGGG